MAHTVFVDGSTVTANRIVAAWLNDADTVTYVRFGNGTSYTGNLTVPGTTSLTGALTYGGVTLSNAVTGTGSMMLSVSPTTTGVLTIANGSAAAPSLAFAGATTTGFYKGTGNSIDATLNGTQVLDINASSFDVKGGLAANFPANVAITGITTVAAGSAAAPSIISATGTADTGMYFPGADIWSIATAGVQRFQVTAAGFIKASPDTTVFLNVTSPYHELATTESTQDILRIRANHASYTGTGLFVYIDRAANSAFKLMDLQAAGASKFTVDGTGAVTIAGTASFSAGLINSGTTVARFQSTTSGAPAGSTGSGVEIYAGNIFSYNRTTSAFVPLTIETSALTVSAPINVSGVIGVTTNNIYMQQKDTGGTMRNIFGLGNDNNVYVGDLPGFSGGIKLLANGTTGFTLASGGAVTIPGTLGVGDITTNGNNKGLYFNGTRNGILGSNAADTVSIAAANANVAVFGAASTSLTGTLGVTGVSTLTGGATIGTGSNVLGLKVGWLTATNTKTSSTALTTLSDLTIAIGAGETWLIEYTLAATANLENTGLSLQVDTPASAVQDIFYEYIPQRLDLVGGLYTTPAMVDFQTASGTLVSWTAADIVFGGKAAINIFVRVTASGAGNVTLGYAQETSSGNALNILRGSRVKAQRTA